MAWTDMTGKFTWIGTRPALLIDSVLIKGPRLDMRADHYAKAWEANMRDQYARWKAGDEHDLVHSPDNPLVFRLPATL